MRNTYFGERWDVPATEDIEQVETPVGERCVHCGEPVVEGDQGFMQVAITEENGQWVGRLRPVHRECNLRAVIGPLSDLDGECRCGVEDSGMSWREEGRAISARLEARGR